MPFKGLFEINVNFSGRDLGQGKLNVIRWCLRKEVICLEIFIKKPFKISLKNFLVIFIESEKLCDTLDTDKGNNVFCQILLNLIRSRRINENLCSFSSVFFVINSGYI